MALDHVPRSRIVGTGAYTPPRVLTNAELEKLVDTSDQWISERTGIRERRIAAPEQTTSDMAVMAAVRALEMAGLEPKDLDMIIVGTVTGDMPMPACAAFVQKKLGVTDIPAFDVSAACAGFLYALSIADQFIRSGMHRHVLIIGAELLSRILDWEDRTTCVLFGDGAGAAVLGPALGDGRGVLSTKLYTDSSLVASLCIPAGGSKERVTAEAIASKRDKVVMNGQDIFKVAVKNLTRASLSALSAAGLSASDVRWVVPHQANQRIILQVAQRLDIPLERYVLNIERYGNTSSASIPLALDEAIRDGRVQRGDTVLMCALGAGVSWGSALIRL
ncbi:MAG TPA: beta-ketoacyl-ACP synthase III [Polyangiaceae bacterium]|nr:beta-ketoacyl-ACP synthase III [Polyangiaceae bacterium]